MAKKIIALLLVLCTVLPMCVACGKKDTTTSTQAITLTQSAEDPEISEINDYLNELAGEHRASVEGKTFTWIGVGVTDETEETGDIEEDALYYRQRDIEDIFGVNWVTAENLEVTEGVHPTLENVRRDVLAGTKAYNAVGGTTAAVCQPLFLQGCLADVSGYDVIDLEQDWWTPSLRDTYQICGATYFLTGMIVRSFYLDSYCVMYNKDVAADYNIPDLYEIVNSGKWTFDKFFKIAEKVPSNENGSGAYRFNRLKGTVIMYAHDIPITKFDETGKPYIEATLSKELSDIADKFSAVFGNEAITAGVTTGEDINVKYGATSFSEMFVKGQFLFYFDTIGEAAYLRQEDIDFGILPIPKGDESQEKYVSYIEPWGAYHVAVPKTTSDEHVTDVILEAMGALAKKYLKPAIYENVLKGRSVYDKASKEMIDLILDGKTYDLVNMLQPDESFVTVLNDCISISSASFTSKYKMQAKIMNNEIKSKLVAIENNNY